MEKVDCYFIGQIARVQRTFTEDDVKRWSLLTQDFNDVYDPEFFSKDFGRPLVPGILSEGLLTEAISKELPGGPCVIIQKELVFIHPVQIDNTITAEIEIIDMNVQRNWITIKVRCRNELRIDVIQGKIILKLL
ncbi:MaoC/PaaZ C-terminal domain-containing protein [Peribacillus butanolivorans]|uniref:MaoC/PaaZ C-terminal domain-containing protein n=1 Tax=Peribacillus butanolivorans TaxID=421767 RepID=UPI00369BB1EF